MECWSAGVLECWEAKTLAGRGETFSQHGFQVSGVNNP
jgi:hypothetical protein